MGVEIRKTAMNSVSALARNDTMLKNVELLGSISLDGVCGRMMSMSRGLLLQSPMSLRGRML